MSCFPCFTSKKTEEVPEQVPVARVADTTPPPATGTPPAVNKPPNISAEGGNEPNAADNNGARTFTFRELAMAAKNFKQESLIGEGGFGKLYKGKLLSGEVVAVKQLDRNGTQGNKEFLDEVLTLTRLNHPNLVKLIGYCADGDQRLLVYEYMSFGSMDVHLHADLSADKKSLDWQTRMKIASGVAQGLEYLHEKANPPILYHNLKPANVLLTEDFDPRLSGYGLAKLTNGDTKIHATPRVMGTYGYCAPEYERQGELTMKSDVYSFGVILLELITGRGALDTTRPTDEQNLVTWAQPIFKDQKKFTDLADPRLEGRFPQKSLNQAVGIAAMCLQEEPSIRPLMGDVLSILCFLAVSPPEEVNPASTPATPLASETNGQENEGDSSSSDDDSDGTSVSSEDNNEDQDERQRFETQNANQGSRKGSSSQKHKDRSDNSKERNSSRSKSGSEDGSSHSSSRSYDDNVFLDESAQENSSDPQGHHSINLRQNSTEERQDGSINSSVGNGRYEDSFAWSMGSNSNYQRHDSSARQNSGHISNMG